MFISLGLAAEPAQPGAHDALNKSGQSDKETDPQVLKKLAWWQDLKFGLFMHWGAYSVWGSVESWPVVEVDHFGRDALPAWQQSGQDQQKFNAMYFALNKQFNPTKFDPDKWAAAAMGAGMKYVVFTTKHHDGFSMFDTKQSDYRITHDSCPFHNYPRANVVKEVFDTFRRAGFGIGAYFSKADWHHPDYWDPQRPHPTRNVNYDTGKEPEKWSRFVNFVHAQIEELMTDYGPVDILWLDAGQVRPPQQDINMPKLASMARMHQPGLIVVDRTVGGRYENYLTPEQEVPAKALPYPWETCMTMGDQWSYKPNENYKSARKLIHLLVDIVAKGGNLLLNIGPNAEGELPAEAVTRLKEIGQWMKVNGEAIYGTRPVAPYKAENICLTQKDEKVYLIYLAKEDQSNLPEEITVSVISSARGLRMLGADEPITWEISDKGLTIKPPKAVRENPPCEHAWAFELTEAKIRPR